MGLSTFSPSLSAVAFAINELPDSETPDSETPDTELPAPIAQHPYNTAEFDYFAFLAENGILYADLEEEVFTPRHDRNAEDFDARTDELGHMPGGLLIKLKKEQIDLAKPEDREQAATWLAQKAADLDPVTCSTYLGSVK